MRKLMVGVIGVFLSACASAPPMPAAPSAEMAARSGTDLATLQRGHAVFVTQCTRCHEAQMPDKVSTEDWHVVVPGMAWNAGISAADEDAVLAYILAAKQS